LRLILLILGNVSYVKNKDVGDMEALFSLLNNALQTSAPLALLLSFAGGILASLTPCVYPMLPITAGVIGHANVGGTRLRGLGLSLLYVLGMALTYALLGVFAAATGGFFGAVGASPWSSLAVGNLMLLFALVMFDVLPMPVLAGKGFGRRLGLAGIFLAGVSAALVAGPCTTPVLGTLLVYASSKSLVMGGLLLFVFSLGMGLLLVVVGVFSGFLTTLPRSGAWMNLVKKGLGVMMLVLAQYFFVKAGTLLL
jgi:cytochrome c-type biogenesis protein